MRLKDMAHGHLRNKKKAARLVGESGGYVGVFNSAD